MAQQHHQKLGSLHLSALAASEYESRPQPCFSLTFVATAMSIRRGVFAIFWPLLKLLPKAKFSIRPLTSHGWSASLSGQSSSEAFLTLLFLYHPMFNLSARLASCSFNRSWIWPDLTTFPLATSPGTVTTASLVALLPPTFPLQSQHRSVITLQVYYKLPCGFCHHIQSEIPSSSRLYPSCAHTTHLIISLPSPLSLSFPNSALVAWTSLLCLKHTMHVPPLDFCTGCFFFLEPYSTRYPNAHCLTSFKSVVRHHLHNESSPGHTI